MTTKILEIKTATIEIKVIRVDGHKMTKATFRQIQNDSDTEIDEESILGWVNDDGYIVVLWNMDGTPRKRSITSAYWLNDLDGSRHRSPYNDSHPYHVACSRYDEQKKIIVQDIKENFPQLFIAT